MRASEETLRLSDLLDSPRETLDVEIKGWLDLADPQHKAVLGKAIIAQANNGGGAILVGFREVAGAYEADEGRPDTFENFTSDSVNGVSQRYAEPAPHCDVYLVRRPTDGMTYPVIVVPPGSVPIRAKKDGPEGRGIKRDTYYIRRPGPSSEAPQNGQEWEALIRRCVVAARADLLDSFRSIMEGAGAVEKLAPSSMDQLGQWMVDSKRRWRALADTLPTGDPGKFPLGYWCVAYQLKGVEPRKGRDLLELVRDSQVRHSGWPPFWVPNRAEIAPYIENDIIECWLGGEAGTKDAAHADFWRVSPEGRFFLIRGYQEDTSATKLIPGTGFDLVVPTWRIGEVLLQAHKVAENWGDKSTTLELIPQWEGLKGRQLVSIGNPRRMLFEGHTTKTNAFTGSLVTLASAIPDRLPELVSSIVIPLYESFGFFQLPSSLVAEELATLRASRF